MNPNPKTDEEWEEWEQRRRAVLEYRRNGEPEEFPDHAFPHRKPGIAAYHAGCRCADCTEAKRALGREWHAIRRAKAAQS